jgi:hypothetical protein
MNCLAWKNEKRKRRRRKTTTAEMYVSLAPSVTFNVISYETVTVK